MRARSTSRRRRASGWAPTRPRCSPSTRHRLVGRAPAQHHRGGAARPRVAIPSLRVQSHYLGIVTLGLAISFTAILTNWSLTGQAIGLPGVPGPTLLRRQSRGRAATTTTSSWPRHRLALRARPADRATRLGRRFKAMRDDAVAAAHSGVEVPSTGSRFHVFGRVRGVAGALYAGRIHYVSPGHLQPRDHVPAARDGDHRRAGQHLRRRARRRAADLRAPEFVGLQATSRSATAP